MQQPSRCRDGFRIGGQQAFNPPSFTETPATRAVVTPERKAASEAAIPLRRVGQPDDIAGLVTVLASPIAAFVTGQTLIADGGLSLTTARPTRDRE